MNALYDALDEQRRSMQLSWAAAARGISRCETGRQPMATSTITGIRNKAQCEGDGILQMLLWLGRTPESFVTGVQDADADRFRLRKLGNHQILRWDATALHAALDVQRQNRGMTWKGLANEVGAFTSGMLTNLAKGGRVGFPRVMRVVRWLDLPAAAFTRASDY